MDTSAINALIREDIDKFISQDARAQFQDRGIVIKIADGVANVSGLASGRINEIVHFASGARGMIFNLEEDYVGVVLLNDDSIVKEGEEAFCSQSVLQIACGNGMSGRVVNALGEPIDGKGEIQGEIVHRDVETTAPGIMERDPVKTPMETGIKIIDGLIPIGRGQRELIIGDRQTGKTSIAISAIINQMKSTGSQQERVHCVYVAIGQKLSSIAQLKQQLLEAGAMEYTTIVVANASDPAPLQFLAPYAGCAIAEHFRDNGMHSLVIYDDLSKHAVAYRQMSLLLRRSPGREAYPGDVFYIHSRLLERAAQMSAKNGGGSLTALPIIETQAGDMSAYIPTNVISITDGQIFLEADLMHKKVLPAINVGLSVSRVGSAAQTKAMSSVAGKMKLELAQYREMETFAQFSSDLDITTQTMLHKGRCLIELLKQSNIITHSMPEQVVIFFLGAGKYLNDIKPSQVLRFHDAVIEKMNKEFKEILNEIAIEKKLNDQLKKKLDKAILQIKDEMEFEENA